MDRLGSITHSDRTRLADSLARLNLDCPPLPHTLLEAMTIRENPGGSDDARVIRMVKQDPMVVARLLRIINSAYYSLASEVDSVERAVRLLGPRAVSELVMGMNVLHLQSSLQGPGNEILGRSIRRCLATAMFSETIWNAVAPPSGSARAFSAGLLKCLGQIVLVYNYPVKAAEVYGLGLEGAELQEHEVAVFGCGSREATVFLAEKHAFPEAMKALLTELYTEGAPIRAVVLAAVRAATMNGFGFQEPNPDASPSTDPDWQDLARVFPERAGDAVGLYQVVMEQRETVSRAIHRLTTRTDRAPRAPGSRPGAIRTHAQD